MTDHPQHGALLGRIFDQLNPRPTPAPEPVAEADSQPQPEPRRREHLYGSAYRGPMDAAEVIRARYAGLGGYRRSLAPSDSAERRRAAAAAITCRGPEILWPE